MSPISVPETISPAWIEAISQADAAWIEAYAQVDGEVAAEEKECEGIYSWR